MAKYTNSPLVGYTGLVNKHSGQRTHCMVGQVTAADKEKLDGINIAVLTQYDAAASLDPSTLYPIPEEVEA